MSKQVKRPPRTWEEVMTRLKADSKVCLICGRRVVNSPECLNHHERVEKMIREQGSK
jgi:hypothetical protein